MIRLETAPEIRTGVALGHTLTVQLVKDVPEIETRFFLRQRPILYTRPLRDWSPDAVLLIFPEAPGDYSLLGQWRLPDAEGGWVKLDFTVRASEKASPAPTRLELSSGVRLWMPNGWEARLYAESERATSEILEAVVRPGMVVYDLGANVGFYSSQMARLAGSEGQVYCFEANPVCIQFLRTNLVLLGLENVEILPVAILDREGTTRFALNYGNSNLGLSEASGFYGAKSGHEIWVQCFRFDQVIDTFHLEPPDLVKIDVEGAEHLVVRGMERTLSERPPVLLLELHGRAYAQGTLEVLDRYGYRYLDPHSREQLGETQAACARLGDAVSHLLAVPGRR